MAAQDSSSDKSLAPTPNPVGLLLPFTQREKTLVLRIPEIAEDSVVVDAIHGNTIFQIKHKRIAGVFNKSMELHDANGDLLFKLQRKPLQLHPTFKGVDATGKDVFTTTPSDISYYNPETGADEVIQLNGNFHPRDVDLTCNGLTVARIRRRIARSDGPVLEAQFATHFLAVAPGADCALLTAFCVCLVVKEQNEYKPDIVEGILGAGALGPGPRNDLVLGK